MMAVLPSRDPPVKDPPYPPTPLLLPGGLFISPDSPKLLPSVGNSSSRAACTLAHTGTLLGHWHTGHDRVVLAGVHSSATLSITLYGVLLYVHTSAASCIHSSIHPCLSFILTCLQQTLNTSAARLLLNGLFVRSTP